MPRTGPFGQRAVEYDTLRHERFNTGMISNVEAMDIPDGAFVTLKNARVRYDKSKRRNGNSLHTPTKPNSNRVLSYDVLRTNAGVSYEYRFTATTIHRKNAGVWTPVVGALTGTVNDKFYVILANDRFFFCNNGADVIQEIAYGADTFAALGNAPKYRFITGFYNRIVGASRASGGALGVDLGWSGNNNFGEWNAAVDKTAGNTPLVESPDDLGDHIKGIFGMSNLMVILRERSIWHVTKLPVPTNPFNPYNIKAGMGCDCPYSAVITEFGLVWVDTRSKAVWAYEIGGRPEPISRTNEEEIFRNVDNPDLVECSYDSKNRELYLLISAAGSTVVRIWIYNFNTKGWAYDEIENVSSLNVQDIGTGFTAINSLVGTINQLSGSINSLSPASTIKPTVLIGKTNGEIYQDDPNSTTDNGTEFETEYKSKVYNFKDKDFEVVETRIFIKAERDTHIQLWYSINEKDFRLVKEVDVMITRSFKFKHKKLYRCTSFQFKIVATEGGIFYPQKIEIDIYPTGESKDANG